MLQLSGRPGFAKKPFDLLALQTTRVRDLNRNGSVEFCIASKPDPAKATTTDRVDQLKMSDLFSGRRQRNGRMITGVVFENTETASATWARQVGEVRFGVYVERRMTIRARDLESNDGRIRQSFSAVRLRSVRHGVIVGHQSLYSSRVRMPPKILLAISRTFGVKLSESFQTPERPNRRCFSLPVSPRFSN